MSHVCVHLGVLNSCRWADTGRD